MQSSKKNWNKPRGSRALFENINEQQACFSLATIAVGGGRIEYICKPRTRGETVAKYRLVDPSTGRIGGWISRGRGFSEEIRPADILAIDLLERVDAFPSNVFPRDNRFFPNQFENVRITDREERTTIVRFIFLEAKSFFFFVRRRGGKKYNFPRKRLLARIPARIELRGPSSSSLDLYK